MKILYAASECVPFVKTGGLADVVGSLPKALIDKNVDVRVVLPYYQDMPKVYKDACQDLLNFDLHMGWRSVYCGIKYLEYEGIPIYFIDNLEFFGREGLYGFWDDGERFAFFSMAVCEMMEVIDFIPNIIHVHDWHAAMIPVLLVHKYSWIEEYKNIRKVLTIHNLRFQGIYNAKILESLFGIGAECFHEGGVKYYDSVNYLQGGINYADIVTTVSPSYAQEIQTAEFGEGLDGILRYNAWKLSGILNGIDTDLYNPATDKRIVENFDEQSLDGKALNKKALQRELGLEIKATTPIIACISRLTDQKGFNLIAEAMEELVQRNMQLVVLGTGDQQYEACFEYFANKYPKKVSATIGFDASLAQRIYAGSDIFLMPSAFEPCGLSQLISLRYGTIPIVHETGGLRDTIIPYNQHTQLGTGFSFFEFNAYVMMRLIDDALSVYQTKDQWRELVTQAMQQDFSWDSSTKQYIALYEELTKK